jgi:GNAT superfamily N-acetyltransferase
VAELFVVPAHQGRGLGRALLLRALLLRAIDWSHAAGDARIGLTVTDGNPAERLYVSAGFRCRRTLFVLETGGVLRLFRDVITTRCTLLTAGTAI